MFLKLWRSNTPSFVICYLRCRLTPGSSLCSPTTNVFFFFIWWGSEQCWWTRVPVISPQIFTPWRNLGNDDTAYVFLFSEIKWSASCQKSFKLSFTSSSECWKQMYMKTFSFPFCVKILYCCFAVLNSILVQFTHIDMTR